MTNANSQAASPTLGREISSTRVLNAPRELVWAIWTDPAHTSEWWGPNGFTTTTKHFDLRPGGRWLFTMHGPDGTDYPNEVTFARIEEPEHLEYDHGPTPQFHVTIRFEIYENTKTRLHWQLVFATKEDRDHVVENFGAIEGLEQTISRLEQYLNDQKEK